MQYKIERNAVVKLIKYKKKQYKKYKKKQYYENMIDDNKTDSRRIWKTLKEILKGKVSDIKFIDHVDFEGVNTNKEISIADKFNEYYINSIDNIINNIKQVDGQRNGRETIYLLKIKRYTNILIQLIRMNWQGS